MLKEVVYYSATGAIAFACTWLVYVLSNGLI